jgi:DNA-binding MarR family transcriptional regulator
MSRREERETYVGTLIRLAAQVLEEERARWLASSKWDVAPASAAVFQPLWLMPQGARITTLAKQSRITKQSMSALVDDLEKKGFVERTPDPEDARATLVRLTAKGRDFARDIRELAREVEKDWEKRIGEKRVAELKTTLALLRDSWLAEAK